MVLDLRAITHREITDYTCQSHPFLPFRQHVPLAYLEAKGWGYRLDAEGSADPDDDARGFVRVTAGAVLDDITLYAGEDGESHHMVQLLVDFLDHCGMGLNFTKTVRVACVPAGQAPPPALVVTTVNRATGASSSHTIRTVGPLDPVLSLGFHVDASLTGQQDTVALRARISAAAHRLGLAQCPLSTRVLLSNWDVLSVAYYFLQLVRVNDAFVGELQSALNGPVLRAGRVPKSIATEACSLPPELLGLGVRNVRGEAAAVAAHTLVRSLEDDPRGVLRHIVEATLADVEYNTVVKGRRPPNPRSRVAWPALLTRGSSALASQGWSLQPAATCLGGLRLRQLLPSLRYAPSGALRALGAMYAREALLLAQPLPGPSRDGPPTSTFERALLQGRPARDTCLDALRRAGHPALVLSPAALAHLSCLPASTKGSVLRATRDALCAALSDTRPSRWVRHLPIECARAFDPALALLHAPHPLHQPAPALSPADQGQWSPHDGIIATDRWVFLRCLRARGLCGRVQTWTGCPGPGRHCIFRRDTR